jgi:hypothetical protein|tara:strand:+ start:145 stop:402 length:258 start_codon:yes stop_codon:yes gene_type:complete
MSSPDGWEGLTQATSDAPRAADIDILYGKVFKSTEGQRVLSHLRSITIEQPTWNPGEDASFGYVRTGMAEMVRIIEKRIERSNNG